MKKIIHCPWCGAEMKFMLTFTTKDLMGGRYDCSNRKCLATSPVVTVQGKPTAQRLEQKAYVTALRRAKRLLRPIPLKKIRSTELLVPCWLEVRGKMYARPVLLDRDSVGFFAKYENGYEKQTEYHMVEDYNREWRCWRRDPSIVEIKDAPWEDEIDG